MDLSQYLVPDIAEWLVKNIIQEPTFLVDFHTKEQLLYLSPDLCFLYTFQENEIRKHDLKKRYSCYTTIRKLTESSVVTVQSLQHPQWIGFSPINTRFLQPTTTTRYLELIDVTSGKTISTWSTIRHFGCTEFYIWDEDLKILLDPKAHSLFETLSWKEMDRLKNGKEIYKTIITTLYICYPLNYEQQTIGKFFNLSDEKNCCDFDRIQEELYLFNRKLHIFPKLNYNHTPSTDLKVKRVGTDIIKYDINNIVKIGNNFIITRFFDLHYSIIQIVM